MQLYLIYTLLLALANAAPLPAIVTKVVTADAVTVTSTEVALTTVTLPVEEIIIIGDNTITTTFTTLTEFAPTDAIPTAITTTHSNGVIALVGNDNVAGDATAVSTSTAATTATGTGSASNRSGSNSNSNSASDANSNSNSDSDANSNSNSDSDANTNSNSDSDANSNSNSDSDANSNSNSDSDANSNSNSASDANSNSNSASNDDSNDDTTDDSNDKINTSSLSITTTSQMPVPTTIALTTTTIPSDSAVAPDADATINLTTTNGKAILPTLTEGLQKDTAVAPTMQNPQTVSVTNSSVASLTSSILSQAATATPSATSTSSSSSSFTAIASSTTSSVSSSANSASSTSSSIALAASGSVTAENSLGDASSASATNTSVATVSSSSVSDTEIIASSTSSTKTSTTSATVAATSSASSDDSDYLTKVPYAVVYSPYTSTQACKSYSDVFADISLIASKGVSQLRIYGNDCNYMTTVLPIASQFGLSVNQGFWISADGVDSIDTAVQNLIDYTVSDAAGYNWSLFEYFTIGNEAVLAGYCTVDELIAKISEVKAKLVAAGYNGLVTTAEPPVTFENNPELCTDSEIDFVGINPHSYFAPSFSAETSGSFVAAEAQIVQNLCGGKAIVITETGYPHAGVANGNNVPTPENQKIALQSILDVYGTHVTILTAFDDYWKQPGQYGIEQSFGMLNWLETISD